MYYIHDREKSQELVLDIFTYIWEHRETFEIRLTLKAYLFQSAKNKALSYIRDKKDVVYIDDISNLEFREVENHKLEMEELQALIQEAVSLLPSKCKEIYKKSREDNLSNKEIATLFNISEKTVEGQITIALKKIRAFLGNSYYYLWGILILFMVRLFF